MPKCEICGEEMKVEFSPMKPPKGDTWTKYVCKNIDCGSWWVKIPLSHEKVELSRTCDFLKFSDKAGGHMCFHYLNDAEECERDRCPIRITDNHAEQYQEDMEFPIRCKHYEQHEGSDYCKTDQVEPALIPVECNGDANKCSLDPPIIIRIWNIIYWRRR